MHAPNAYSRRWFSTFLGRIDASVVERETAFLARQLPWPPFRTVLDLCCGPGRHLAPLAGRGYAVVGLDRDRDALLAALRASEGAGLVRGDMHALPIRDGALDAVVCMWQSFGYRDPAANRAVLADAARILRPGGRLVLDLYHREHFERHQGRRAMERDGVRVVEERRMLGRRLRVRLYYDDGAAGAGDEFEWELYTPAELAAEGERAGLAVALACTGFDETRAPAAEEPRMQLVFERVAEPAPETPARARA